MNSLKEKLHTFEERILGWPDNVPPTVDPDVAFESLEEELRKLLAQIAALPTDERAEFKTLISTFHDNIQQHHVATEQKLREIQSVVDTNLQYVKAVRAYSMGN